MSDGLERAVNSGVCRFTSGADAFRNFATSTDSTQSAAHIKPVHWYVACRLVIEGGFRPEEVIPRPPFDVQERRGHMLLSYDPTRARGGEAAILGGLKTKNVDVAVMKEGIGPALAISCKGMTGALRNLTNRMEETVGECTNLHITYPALVFGYLFLMKANRAAEHIAREASQAETDEALAQNTLGRNDAAIAADGTPVESLVRFEYALAAMQGRRGIRDDISRYESVALALVDATDSPGTISHTFPRAESSIRIEPFFQTLYARYEERFVYSAPLLGKVTRRLEWSPDSPVFGLQGIKLGLDYEPRLAW